MKTNYLFALGSAILLWLAWPPSAFASPLLLVALVPVLIAVENTLHAGAKKTGKKVFLLCFSCFFVWNTASVYWVFNSLYAELGAVMPGITGVVVSLLISLIPYSLAALLMALAFRLYYALRKKRSLVVSYAGLVSFWIGYEYLHQTWDLAFPWMTLGNGFAVSHQLVQWYEYTGIYGGSLWILLSNILVFESWRAFKEPAAATFRGRLLAVTALVITVPMLISLILYTRYKEVPDPANIVVVQPNIDPYSKFSTPAYQQINTLVRLSDSVGQKNTEFFIWPETAISSPVDEAAVRANPYFMQAQQFLLKYKNGTLISGIESYSLYDSAKTESATYEENIRKYVDRFNAAIKIENSPEVAFYHKSKLVPGVEETPFSSALSFLKPAFAAFGGATGSYGKQPEPSVLYAQSGIGVAPVICFDSIWGDWVGGSVKKGAQFIAVMTNDGWWGNTSGKDEHFDYAKLRAIETRRWVARAANTGISGFINQRGDVVSKSSWWTATALKADINLNEELTFYVKHGDYIAGMACLGCGIFSLLLVVSLVNRKRVL